MKSELLKADEVCRDLRVSRKTLYNMIAARIFPVIRFNSRTLRFRPEAVEAFLARRESKLARPL